MELLKITLLALRLKTIIICMRSRIKFAFCISKFILISRMSFFVDFVTQAVSEMVYEKSLNLRPKEACHES